MSIGYVDCPYCNVETEITYEGVNSCEEFDCECNNCLKHFKCNYEVSHTYNISKYGSGI